MCPLLFFLSGTIQLWQTLKIIWETKLPSTLQMIFFILFDVTSPLSVLVWYKNCGIGFKPRPYKELISIATLVLDWSYMGPASTIFFIEHNFITSIAIYSISICSFWIIPFNSLHKIFYFIGLNIFFALLKRTQDRAHRLFLSSFSIADDQPFLLWFVVLKLPAYVVLKILSINWWLLITMSFRLQL